MNPAQKFEKKLTRALAIGRLYGQPITATKLAKKGRFSPETARNLLERLQAQKLAIKQRSKVREGKRGPFSIAWLVTAETPAPVEPAPVEPAPVEPAPVEPAPVEPAPVEPAPVEPAPVEPCCGFPA